jgi:hypothetical protein
VADWSVNSEYSLLDSAIDFDTAKIEPRIAERLAVPRAIPINFPLKQRAAKRRRVMVCIALKSWSFMCYNRNTSAANNFHSIFPVENLFKGWGKYLSG